MRYLMVFIFGVIVATAGQLMAQSGSIVDQYGNQGLYNTVPGGSVNVWTAPGFGQRQQSPNWMPPAFKPC
jgi:hypothetical protein